MKSHSLISNQVTNDDDVVIRLDVNIDDSNKIEKLEILQGQNIEEAVRTFCDKFNISNIKKERLFKIVEERLGSK